MPCHATLVKLAGTDPGAVLAAAERLVVPLEKTLTTRLKSDAVKQEVGRGGGRGTGVGAGSCRRWGAGCRAQGVECGVQRERQRRLWGTWHAV